MTDRTTTSNRIETISEKRITLTARKDGNPKARLDLENGVEDGRDEPDLIELSAWKDGFNADGHHHGIVGRESWITMYSVNPEHRALRDSHYWSYVNSFVTANENGNIELGAKNKVTLRTPHGTSNVASTVVSTTEPTRGYEGQQWFNPSTGQLHIYTEN